MMNLINQKSRKYKLPGKPSQGMKTLLLALFFWCLFFGLLAAWIWGDEPYDSINPLRPVPRPDAWPSDFASSNTPDLFNETNYWALFWAINERIEAVSEFNSQLQKFEDSNGFWQAGGTLQEWKEWPVEPIVFYWSSPIAHGIVTTVLTQTFFGLEFTSEYVYVDFTLSNSIVTHTDPDYLPLQTNYIRFNLSGSTNKSVTWGDPNYGKLAAGYSEDLFDESPNSPPEKFLTTRRPFTNGDPFALNVAEDIFFGAIYGTGKSASEQMNWMDGAIREITPYYVNHLVASNPESYFETSTGTVYRWGADRDGTNGADSAGWEPWHGDYPESIPFWTLDSIGAELVSRGVGAFLEFPSVSTNVVTEIPGWRADPPNLTKETVFVTNALVTNLNRSWRFTLWETNFFQPVTFGYIEIAQTNVKSLWVFDSSTFDDNGQEVSYAGTYARTGETNGKAILSGPSGKIWWTGGRWAMGPNISSQRFTGPEHDLFGDNWVMATGFEGSPGYVHRREINVGPITHDIGGQNILSTETVRHQDYKPLSIVIYPNQASNTINCSIAITGITAGIKSGAWSSGSTGEILSVSGVNGSVSTTAATYFNLSALTVATPATGWIHRLTNNILPSNHLNGIVIQAEWTEPVPLYAPIDPEPDESPYLINNHASFWRGLWERAQYINLLKWTAKQIDAEPDRALTAHEAEPDILLFYDEKLNNFYEGLDLNFTTGVTLSCVWNVDSNTFTTSNVGQSDFPSYRYEADMSCDNKNWSILAQPYGRVEFDWRKSEPVTPGRLIYRGFTDQISADIEGFHRFSVESVSGWDYREQSVEVDAHNPDLEVSAADAADIRYDQLVDRDSVDFFTNDFKFFRYALQGTATKGETNRTVTVHITDGSSFAPDPATDSFLEYNETDNDTILTNGIPNGVVHSQTKSEESAKLLDIDSNGSFLLMKWNFKYTE